MTAPNGEGQSFAATGPQEQTKERTDILPDFDTPRQMVEQMRAALEKRIANARARLAMQGFECHIIAGGFTVFRWGHARDIESLDELERFVEHVCGGRA